MATSFPPRIRAPLQVAAAELCLPSPGRTLNGDRWSRPSSVYTGLRSCSAAGACSRHGCPRFPPGGVGLPGQRALSLVWLDRLRAKMSQGFGNAVSRVNDKTMRQRAAEDEPLTRPPTPKRQEQEADA